jgi:membrane protease YdiL (CAAX protease family)
LHRPLQAIPAGIQPQRNTNLPQLKPMPWWQSLLYFGIPGAIGYWNAYFGIPRLVQAGVPMTVAFPLLLSGMGVLLLGVALLAYRLEGNPWRWSDMKVRLRLQPIRGKAWLWVLGVLGVCVISDASFDGLGKWLASFPLFAPPDYFPPPFNPRFEIVFPMVEFLGAPFKGNWAIFWLWAPLSLVSMLGEELLWRGYILPRQELSLGRWAWVLNGLLWAYLFHAGLKWQFIGMWPSMLLTAWIAQRLKNTWASSVVHVGGNAILFWTFLLAGILGLG